MANTYTCPNASFAGVRDTVSQARDGDTEDSTGRSRLGHECFAGDYLQHTSYRGWTGKTVITTGVCGAITFNTST